MRLIKLDGPDGPIYINPEHVVAIYKGMKDTKIETLSGQHVVKDAPDVVARMLGAEDLAIDLNPRLTYRA
jgi:hypothetical protein